MRCPLPLLRFSNHIQRGALTLLSCLLFLLPGAVIANPLNLYQAEVPIASEETDQRKVGFRDALEQVLVKVTGNRGIASRSSLQEALNNAAPYVQQFSYRVLPSEAQDEAPQRLLKVVFDKGLIDRLLREKRIPLWSSNRPLMLIWVGLETKGGRRLFDPERDRVARSEVESAGAERGLPIVFPLMDLEDRTQLQVADLWGEFESNIRMASRRYNPDLVATLRLSELDPTRWRGRWNLYEKGDVHSWEGSADTRQGVVAEGVNRLADMLAAKYAPVSTDEQLSKIRLQVDGVDNLRLYAEVTRHLESVGDIDGVETVSFEADRVTYDLLGGGSAAALGQALAVGGIIEPVPGGQTAEGEAVPVGVDLYFRLR